MQNLSHENMLYLIIGLNILISVVLLVNLIKANRTDSEQVSEISELKADNAFLRQQASKLKQDLNLQKNISDKFLEGLDAYKLKNDFLNSELTKLRANKSQNNG